MGKTRSKFLCQECGYESPKWLGRCPGCQQWNTMVEETFSVEKAGKAQAIGFNSKPISIRNVISEDDRRVLSRIGEFDRVLGGGCVLGSLVLIGGDPGIGKSTLLLQVANQYCHSGEKVLYVSGEESPEQIKIRAERLGTLTDNLLVLAENNINAVGTWIEESSPSIIVIDSIQTVYNDELTSSPGSVSQVRECAGHFLRIAKTKKIPIFLVGHVTKEGALAGPRVLEHMVDTVLYLEGERHQSYRILRAVKNRFGSTNEIGVFEMQDKGLIPVNNPSEFFLTERPEGLAGSTVIASMEGSRPMLVEIQALVSPTGFGTPRRMTAGIDYNRTSLILAVLEKRVGFNLHNMDTFVSLAGGFKVDEPAADLGIALAIASSFRDLPLDHSLMVIGEVGLAGEVRGISQAEKRVIEAEKLGFKCCVLPQGNLRGLKGKYKINLIGVASIKEALDKVLGG